MWKAHLKKKLGSDFGISIDTGKLETSKLRVAPKYLPYGLLASIEEYISWTGADVKNKYFYDNLNRVIEDWCHTYL